MKTMTELREAFRKWRQPHSKNNALRGGIDASRILDPITDPTPITEAGLLELGFERWTLRTWMCGVLLLENRLDGRWLAEICREYLEVKNLGQLRGLLLFVGE